MGILVIDKQKVKAICDQEIERISTIENQFPDIYKALNYLVEKDTVKENNNKRNKIGYKK